MQRIFKTAYELIIQDPKFETYSIKQKTIQYIEHIEKCGASLKGISKWALKIDQIYQSDQREHIDDPNFPFSKKIKIVEGLHLKNTLFGTYQKMTKELLPIIKNIYKNENRPVKILEIAGGSGNMILGLHQVIKKQAPEIEVELTGSDIVKEYVELANKKVKKKNQPIQYKVINALDLTNTNPDEYDLLINLHSMHHFSPLFLLQVIEGSLHAAKYAFYAVDGVRTFGNLFFMMGTALLPSIFEFNPMYIHDATISGRKMYHREFIHYLFQLLGDHIQPQTKKLSLGLNSFLLTHLTKKSDEKTY